MAKVEVHIAGKLVSSRSVDENNCDTAGLHQYEYYRIAELKDAGIEAYVVITGLQSRMNDMQDEEITRLEMVA